MSNFKNIVENTPIYYINLKRAEDRKKYIEDYFHNNNITNFKRIEGIDGSNITKETFAETYTLDANPKLNLRDMACALSHYKAIEEVLNDGHDYALIMEDDCSFEYLKYQTQSIQDIIASIKDWEIIKLSTIDEFDSKSRKKNPEEPLNWIIKSNYNMFDYRSLVKERFVKKRVGLSGLQGYLINNKTCKKLIENKLNVTLGASEPTIFKNISPHVVYPPYFSYFYYGDVKSSIRTGKAGHAVQTYSKMFWDAYYKSIEKTS